MTAWTSVTACVLALSSLIAFAQKTESPPPLTRILEHSPLPNVPADPTNAFATDPDAARLGQFLFFDQRLSGNGALSCASCHDPAQSFSDGRSLSQGLDVGKRNTPALWNVAWQRWYFLDGRADSLWSQALHPLETETELGTDRVAIAHLIDGDPQLHAAYAAIFGATGLEDHAPLPSHAKPMPSEPDDPRHRAWIALTDADRAAVNRIFANVGKALAAYECKLESTNSAFDRYAAALRAGDATAQAAYPESARRGLALFVGKANCQLCHAGPNFTDNEFHNIGVPPLVASAPRDLGRYAGVLLAQGGEFNAKSALSDAPRGTRAAELDQLVTSGETWGQFKTPSLRNVALTAPYMHQGQFASLDRVLQHYSTMEGSVPAGHHGEQVIRPLHLDDTELRDLKAFLESLTDADLDPSLLAKPDSPRSSGASAKPASKSDGERP